MAMLKRITPLVLGLTLGLPVTSFAAVDIFLEIDGVEGESQASGKEGQIDVLAWSWGASNDYVGKRSCSIQDLSITKWVDSASPDILMAQVAGEYFENATLTVRRAGGGAATDYIEIKFFDLRVTSVSTGGSGGEDRLTENVTLNFSNATYSYTPLNPDGSAGAKSSATINGCY